MLSFSTAEERVYLYFTRQAPTLAEAIKTAQRDIEKAGLQGQIDDEARCRLKSSIKCQGPVSSTGPWHSDGETASEPLSA
jgi:hypothetical protein